VSTAPRGIKIISPDELDQSHCQVGGLAASFLSGTSSEGEAMAIDSFIEHTEPGSGGARRDSRTDLILTRPPRSGKILVPWALDTAAPTEVDLGKWAVALRQSVRQLFPVS
jgi:hypothetical protein